MREAEQHTGCRILTYTILDHPMHTLLFVLGDSPKDLSDEEVVKRVVRVSVCRTEGDGEEDFGKVVGSIGGWGNERGSRVGGGAISGSTASA